MFRMAQEDWLRFQRWYVNCSEWSISPPFQEDRKRESKLPSESVHVGELSDPPVRKASLLRPRESWPEPEARLAESEILKLKC